MEKGTEELLRSLAPSLVWLCFVSETGDDVSWRYLKPCAALTQHPFSTCAQLPQHLRVVFPLTGPMQPLGWKSPKKWGKITKFPSLARPPISGKNYRKIANFDFFLCNFYAAPIGAFFCPEIRAFTEFWGEISSTVSKALSDRKVLFKHKNSR